MAARKGMSGVIRRICLWCQGESWMRVRECAHASCPLHSCRLMEDGDESAMHGCIRNFCLACAGSPEAVEECSADKPMGGQPACPAHPCRTAEFVPVAQQPASVQQVRPLPGLGGSCVPRPEEPVTFDDGCPHQVANRTTPVMAPVAGQNALSVTHAERAPEALDI